jgi:hypothetical protein
VYEGPRVVSVPSPVASVVVVYDHKQVPTETPLVSSVVFPPAQPPPPIDMALEHGDELQGDEITVILMRINGPGETTLETRGEDAKIHSKRVKKMLKTTLETSGEDAENYTRNECDFSSLKLNCGFCRFWWGHVQHGAPPTPAFPV